MILSLLPLAAVTSLGNVTFTVKANAEAGLGGATGYAVGDGISLTADCMAGSDQWQTSADGITWTNIPGATGKTYSAAALYIMNNVQFRCVAKNTGAAINTNRVTKAAVGVGFQGRIFYR